MSQFSSPFDKISKVFSCVCMLRARGRFCHGDIWSTVRRPRHTREPGCQFTTFAWLINAAGWHPPLTPHIHSSTPLIPPGFRVSDETDKN
jgi:hypothetical protein